MVRHPVILPVRSKIVNYLVYFMHQLRYWLPCVLGVVIAFLAFSGIASNSNVGLLPARTSQTQDASLDIKILTVTPSVFAQQGKTGKLIFNKATHSSLAANNFFSNDGSSVVDESGVIRFVPGAARPYECCSIELRIVNQSDNLVFLSKTEIDRFLLSYVEFKDNSNNKWQFRDLARSRTISEILYTIPIGANSSIRMVLLLPFIQWGPTNHAVQYKNGESLRYSIDPEAIIAIKKIRSDLSVIVSEKVASGDGSCKIDKSGPIGF